MANSLLQRGTSKSSGGRMFMLPTQKNPVVTKTPDYTSAQERQRRIDAGAANLNQRLGGVSNIAQPEQAQTAMTQSRGAFDLAPETPRQPIDADALKMRAQQESDVALGRDAETKKAQQQSRAFFTELGNANVSQQELMDLTGATTAQEARQILESGQYANEFDKLVAKKAIEKRKAELMTEEERIRADVEAMYKPQYEAARRSAQQASETAFRVQGRAAQGTKSAEQQQDIADQRGMIEQSIAAQQRMEERAALAAARGASAEEIQSINDQVNAAKEQRAVAQQELELMQQGLDEKSLAIAKQRNEESKLALDALKSGYQYDPETGKFEALSGVDGMKADMEASQQLGYLVGADGQPVLNNAGNIVEMPKDPNDPKSNFQKIEQEDPFTGEKKIIGYFDPSTARTVYYGGGTGDPNTDPATKNYRVRDANGSQCGEAVNDNTEGVMPDGRKIWFTNKYDEKKEFIDPEITPETAQPGNTLVIPMTVGGALETGHVAMVIGVSGDGQTIYVDEFNRNGDEQLTRGSYSVAQLDQYAQQTGKPWGFSPTRFKENVRAGGIASPAEVGSAMGGGESVSRPNITENEVRTIAKKMGKSPKEEEEIVAYWKRTGQAPRGKPLGGTEANRLAEGNEAIQAVQQIKDLVEGGLPGAGVGFMASLPGGAALMPGTTKKAAKLKIASQVVGRFLEGGVLRKEDEIKYAEMLPNVKDTPEVAKNKWNNVMNVVLANLENKIQSYQKAGFDTVEFEQQMAELRNSFVPIQESSEGIISGITGGSSEPSGEMSDEELWASLDN